MLNSGDSVSLENLYVEFQSTTKRLILSTLGPHDVDDKVHDCFLIVLQAIRSGQIRNPDRIMGFVSTVVRRYIIREIHSAVDRRKRMVECDEVFRTVRDAGENPEQAIIAKQRMRLARIALSEANPVDRDVLRRFYVDEQTKEKICGDMQLSGRQFDMLKMRAKKRATGTYKALAA